MRKTVRCAVVSLGCPKNLVDSEQMLGWLSQSGFGLTSHLDAADAIIVNTCGFLKEAVDESITELRRLTNLKKKGHCKALIAVGCLVSRYPELVRQKVPEVDECIGVLELNRVTEATARLLGLSIHRQVDWTSPTCSHRLVSTPPWYAYLKIAEGCDRPCTFCVIPTIRGKQKSRPMEELVAEAQDLVEQGVRELILIAQDTTRYGVDLYGKPKLSDLVWRLAGISGVKWVRLLYCYPSLVSEKLIATMAENERVAKYIDIPLQHSHPEILMAMQRGGDDISYAKLIEKLREAMPDIAIRTAFIVGFPGETDKHFEHLLQFVKAMRFDRLGVFIFSPEEGTAAAQLPNQVPVRIAEERKHILLTVQQDISRRRNEAFIGQELEVVLEGINRRKNAYETRSQYEAPEIDGVVLVHRGSRHNERIGVFKKVKIVGADVYDLYAEFVGERRQSNDRRTTKFNVRRI